MGSQPKLSAEEPRLGSPSCGIHVAVAVTDSPFMQVCRGSGHCPAQNCLSFLDLRCLQQLPVSHTWSRTPSLPYMVEKGEPIFQYFYSISRGSSPPHFSFSFGTGFSTPTCALA